MRIEDVKTSGPVASQSITDVTRYALGARGVDMISRTTSSGTTLSFPMHDGHGNKVGALVRSGGGFSVVEEMSFDAWGSRRAGIKGTGQLEYVGNLGHKADDESGLIYMRARYYEPGTGRFVSEDPAMDGGNWFVYCGNDPANFVDRAGTERNLFGLGASFGILFLLLAWSIATSGPIYDPKSKLVAMQFVLGAIASFSFALGETKGGTANTMKGISFLTMLATPGMPQILVWVEATVMNMTLMMRLGSWGQVAGFATIAYSVMLMAAVLVCYEDGNTDG